MTFKDLKNKLSKVKVFSDNENKLGILTNKPFWIWNKEQHFHEFNLTKGNCCFQHICGCPTREGKEFPLFDYEKIAYDSLMLRSSETTQTFKDKHIWVKKATGLGITEFMLRFMA